MTTGINPNYSDPENVEVSDDQIEMHEHMREQELLRQDLASDSDDFARSDEGGWYYSDDDFDRS